MAGKLVIFSGPSGAGKSTIVQHLMGIESLNLVFSISATSRKKRDGEIDGKHYHFLSVDDFKSKIDDNEFLEWEEVYNSLYYGTLKHKVTSLLISGKNVVFDVDVVGGLSIKREYKEDALCIFVEPPSIEELEIRLSNRKTETPESIRKRIKKANMEMRSARRFDHKIVNDRLEKALTDAENLVTEFIQK